MIIYGNRGADVRLPPLPPRPGQSLPATPPGLNAAPPQPQPVTYDTQDPFFQQSFFRNYAPMMEAGVTVAPQYYPQASILPPETPAPAPAPTRPTTTAPAPAPAPEPVPSPWGAAGPTRADRLANFGRREGDGLDYASAFMNANAQPRDGGLMTPRLGGSGFFGNRPRESDDIKKIGGVWHVRRSALTPENRVNANFQHANRQPGLYHFTSSRSKFGGQGA